MHEAFAPGAALRCPISSWIASNWSSRPAALTAKYRWSQKDISSCRAGRTGITTWKGFASLRSYRISLKVLQAINACRHSVFPTSARAPIWQVVLLGLGIVSACNGNEGAVRSVEPCSDEWNLDVEAKVQTGDTEGHGPDIGSVEWQSVVEFKLGVRGNPDVPTRDSEAWCTYIDTRLRRPGE